jgi:RNA polymerase sigma-70 factor (ECF subfamily)
MELSKNERKATDWVNEYSDILYNYVAQRVTDTHIAKDLVQETFLAAWRNIDKYNGEASVKTWLFTILKNKIIDHYRKASSRLTDELAESAADESVFFDNANHWDKNAYPLEWGSRPESNLESKEFYSILTNCKKKLKDIQAAVFSLKYMEDLSSEEICKELNITSSNYWVLIHRAKVQLRSCLESNWMLK